MKERTSVKLGGNWQVHKLKEKKYMQGDETQVKIQCRSFPPVPEEVCDVPKSKVKGEKRREPTLADFQASRKVLPNQSLIECLWRLGKRVAH